MKPNLEHVVILPDGVDKWQVLSHIKLGMEFAILKRESESGEDHIDVDIFKENNAEWYYYYRLFLLWMDKNAKDRDARFLRLIANYSYLYATKEELEQ